MIRSFTVIHWTDAAASTASWTVNIVAELQVVPMQTKLGARQSAFVVHVVLHAPVPHMYGEQDEDAGVLQVPPPLQVAAGVSVEPVLGQLAAAHCVPEAYWRQAPLPLQNPSRPQVEAATIVQLFSGSWPAGTEAQVPREVEIAHDRQVPAHAVEQQTFCAQIPELHSLPAAQLDPLGLLPQLPPMQTFGAAQSVPVEHVVLHTRAVVSQPYGSQSELVTVRHTPAPSQVRAGVSVEPVQVPATHTVAFAYCWQAPMPLHRPLVPHVGAPASMHCVAGVGGIPGAMLPHVPADAVNAHD